MGGDYNARVEQKFFHGAVHHAELARAIAQQFNRGNLQARIYSEQRRSVVELSTRAAAQSGGRTALSVIIQQHEDGVAVSMGQQDYLGVAASLGASALYVLRNPLNLLGRLDDVAQDVQYLRLGDEIQAVIDKEMRLRGASTQMSTRLQRDVCLYCSTPNVPGELNCVACGAPLTDLMPVSCSRCGYILKRDDQVCANCGQPRP